MKDNKQKRFEYLRANKAYLSEREKQEYYELVEEIEGWQALEEEYAADLIQHPQHFYPNVGKRKKAGVQKRILMMKHLRKQQVKNQRKRKDGSSVFSFS